MKLLDVCDFQGGSQPPKEEWIGTPREGYVRMLQIRDYSQGEDKFIQYVKDTTKLHKCNKNDIMLSRYGYIGQAFTGLEGAYNVALVKVIKKRQIDTQYLFYYFQSEYFRHSLLSNVGARATIPGFNKTELVATEIPVPKTEIQIEIREKLSMIDKLLKEHHKQIKMLDMLVKSRFVEMFGDPVLNEMCWEQVPLSICIENIDNGKSFVCDSEARQGDWPAVLKLSAATYGFYRPEENKAILDKNQFVEDAAVRDGDLLFTRKNTPELVGMCAYVYDTPGKLMMPDLIFRLNTTERCNKVFLWKLINHDLFRDCIQAIATGSAKSMSNISKERLLGLKIILPPIERQKEFAAFVAQTDKSKLAIQQSLEKLETLKKSLMQEYFS
ncbi:MAG: restriction endonuclease subunit S [Eubacterium sp.]|nr:restriction endonuclease subunit S [Eubacterium sp.]